jgi:hypothetical protein
MPGYRSAHASSSSSTATATALAPPAPMSGPEAPPPVCAPVDTCETDPFDTLESSIAAGDACGAWSSYQQLTSEGHTRVFRDRALQRSLVALVVPVYGASTFDQISLDLCLAPVGAVVLAHSAGVLDAALTNHLVAGPGATAETQASLLRSPEVAGWIVAAIGTQRADLALVALAGSPSTFAGLSLVPGAFQQWVFRSDADFEATFQAVGTYSDWHPVFVVRNDWERVIRLSAGAAGSSLWSAFESQPGHMDWLCAVAAKPIAEGLVLGFQALFSDGSAYSLNTKYLAFQVLYGNKLGRAGQDWDRNTGPGTINWASGATTSGTYFQKYHAVDPNDQAMDWFFLQFGQLPRSHVNTVGQILMTDTFDLRLVSSGNPDVYLNGQRSVVPTATPIPLTTSYYTDENKILMRSINAAGAPDAALVQDIGSGPGRGPNAVNRTGAGNRGASANPDLNFFQNHATHEVGHSVGVRPLNLAPLNGATPDNWTKSTFGWSDGSPEGYARTLGFTSSMDTTTYRLRDAGIAVNLTTPGSVIRDFLADWAKGVQSTPAALVDTADMAKFPDAPTLYNAIKNHAVLGASLFFRTVDGNGGAEDDAYRFHRGIASGASEVHMWCTRDTTKKWVKYNTVAWTQKPSHYATSSHREYFAEMYTAHYNGGGRLPTAAAPVFAALDRATDTDFGALPTPAAPTPGASPGGSAEAGGASPLPPPGTPGYATLPATTDRPFTGFGA